MPMVRRNKSDSGSLSMLLMMMMIEEVSHGEPTISLEFPYFSDIIE